MGRKSVQALLQDHFGTKNMTGTINVLSEIVEGAKSTTEAVAMLKSKTEGKLSFSGPAFINFVRSALKSGRVKKGTTLYNLCHRPRGRGRGNVHSVVEPVAEVQAEVTA